MEKAIKNCPICGGKLVGTYLDYKGSAYISSCHGCGVDVYEYINKQRGKAMGVALVSPATGVWAKGYFPPMGESLLNLEVCARSAGFKEDGTIALGKKANFEDCLSYVAKAYNAATKLERVSVIRTLTIKASSRALKKIVADLTDWSNAYPTGVIAYDSDDSVMDSAYCDNADEFAEFFEDHKEWINEDSELIFKINSEDFGNPELDKLVSAIQDTYKEILEGGNNNEV